MLRIILILSTFTQVSCDRSFTLVLDTTKSMEAEILVVRANIEYVLDNLNSYSNFVLVPFKDSAVEQIFSTPSVQEYLSHLNSITTFGGEDCPENSLAGIEAALRASEKQSTIFVFTDGYAKDGHKLRAVETLCRETHSQVIIFLSGHCIPSRNGPVGNVEVYYDIARACSGAMLKWDSLVDLREAFKYMKKTVNTDWTNVTTFEKVMGFKQISFSVNRFTTDLMIVVSGWSPVVQVSGSNYQNVRFESVVRTRQPLVLRIIPEVGEYTLDVRGQGPIAVTFYERTHVPFVVGFSTKSPRNIIETSAKPIAGWTNYILINVDDSIKLRSVEWLNFGDSVKQVLLLKRIPSGSYVCSVFVEQGKMFRFWIIGEDVTNQREIKGTSKLLAPQVPVNEDNIIWMEPDAELLDSSLGLVDYGSSLVLAARVIGFPKPDVSWRDDTDEILPSETTLLEIPSVFISYMTIPNLSRNSTISCHARNDKGDIEISIDVFVNRTFTFEVIKSPEDASVEFGNEHRLECQMDAYPEATITWHFNGSLIDATNNRLSIEANALVINDMGFEDVGTYECKTSNGVESKVLAANIDITGVEAPQIDDSDTEINFKPSDVTKEIQCRITRGKPDPTISWKYKPFRGSDFDFLPYGASDSVPDKVLFEKIDKSHAGVYRCIASNAMGEDTKDFNIQILSPPVIKNSEFETMSVRQGFDISLPCEVEATPQANVRWEMSQGDVITTFDHRHWTDEKHTHHFRAAPNDSGNYHCVAENVVGKAERTVVLNVLVPPYIESQPERFYANIGGTVTLPCNVLSGNPTPVIRWEFRPKHSTTSTRLNTGKSSLKIETVSKNHEGSYMCIAENQLNTDSIKYDLVVQ